LVISKYSWFVCNKTSLQNLKHFSELAKDFANS
jgi:hypothetical protein